MNRTAARTSLLLAASLAFAGPALAGKKKKKDKGGDAPAAAAASAVPDTPDDKNSKKFGEALVAVSISNWSPSDGGGAKFEYTTLSFNADNSWKGEGYVEIADERMECTETGKWSMDTAESATTATVTWTLDQTDCPGRESGGETRAVVTVTKSGIDAKFR